MRKPNLAARKTADGRWRFTNETENGRLISAFGPCVDCAGHDTPEEAREHYAEHARKSAEIRRLRVDPETCDAPDCTGDAVAYVTGFGGYVWLCRDHASVEQGVARGVERAKVRQWYTSPMCTCGRPATHAIEWPGAAGAVMRCEGHCGPHDIEAVATDRATLREVQGQTCSVPECGRVATMAIVSKDWQQILVCSDHATLKSLVIDG